MSLQEDFERHNKFNEGVRNYLLASKENTLTESTLDVIMNHIHKKNYLQLIYTYGISILNELIAHYLEEEYYERCVLIRDTVIRYTKATGEQIKLEV